MSKKRLFWSYLSWPWFEFLTSLNVAVQPSNKAQYKSEDDFCPFVFQFTKQAKKAAESLETVGKSAMMASKSKVIAKGGASAVTAGFLYIFLRHQVLGHRKRLGISCHSWLSFISYSYFGIKSKVIAKDGFSCHNWLSFISYFGSKSKVIAKYGASAVTAGSLLYLTLAASPRSSLKVGFSCRSWLSFISYFDSKSKVIAKCGF